MTTLKQVGYWRSDRVPVSYPHPREVIHRWDPELKQQVITYLRAGHTLYTWLGFAACRFRDGPPPAAMGNRDLTDGVWVWPEGLAVYVQLYDVGLPHDFLHHAAATSYQIPPSVDIEGLRQSAVWSDVDWVRWSGRARSNTCLAIASRLIRWLRPSTL